MPFGDSVSNLPSVLVAAGGAAAGVYLDFIPATLLPGFIPGSLIPGIEASVGVLVASVLMDFFPQVGTLSTTQKERFMLSTFISTFCMGMFGDSIGFTGIEETNKLMLGAVTGVLVSAYLPESYHLIK